MKARRATLLKEMGLGPRWVSRANNAVADKQPHGEASNPDTKTDSRRDRILAMDWPQLETSIAACNACELCKTRTNVVVGVGDKRADWLIIGEAPGADEDLKGEPFVGQAGKLLDNMLAAIGLKRGDNVYIANALKCRPPGNRNPHPQELAQCEPYLTRQIALIQPKLIVVLGRIAAQALLASDATLSSMRGHLHTHHGIPVVVTYHPAYLLRNLPHKARAWEDLCFALQTFKGL
ncbi:MAG: uracil-DNA glycosylase [Burkholderiales bacterium]